MISEWGFLVPKPTFLRGKLKIQLLKTTIGSTVSDCWLWVDCKVIYSHTDKASILLTSIWYKPLDISICRVHKVRLNLSGINKIFRSMMYCSSEKPNVLSIYRLTTCLPLNRMYQHQATLVSLISLAEKMRQQHSSHSSLLLSTRSEAGTRLAGAASWVVGAAWALCQGPRDTSSSVLGQLLHICQWTQTASPWWQGLRCYCIRPWLCCRHLGNFCLFSVAWKPSCCSQICIL